MLLKELNQARLLLSFLRKGDYAHAGDVEAIDLVLSKLHELLKDISQKTLLDVGSGLGGTANYLLKAGFKKVVGLDLDKSAIEYSRHKYRDIDFFDINILELSPQKLPHQFSVFTFFNVLYTIENKEKAFKNLATIADENAVLVLFDYNQTTYSPLEIADLAGKIVFPLNNPTIKDALTRTGWEVIFTEDLTARYIKWYENIINELLENEEIKLSFSAQTIATVLNTFQFLLDLLYSKQLGGTVIYANLSGARKNNISI